MLAADSPKVTALVEWAYTSAGIRADRAEPAVSASMAEKFQSYLAAMARKMCIRDRGKGVKSFKDGVNEAKDEINKAKDEIDKPADSAK